MVDMANNGNTTHSASAEERRYKAFELKRAGKSYRDIAKELGCGRTQAQRDVIRVLREMRPPQEDVDHHRAMLISRYEFLLEKLFPKLENKALIGESGVYDRILKTLNQIADITGVKEKQQVQTPSEMDLSAYADLLEQADSQ